MPSAEDRLAITEVLNRMAYYYDEGHLDELGACFADDAIMSMQIAGGDMVGPSRGAITSWNCTEAPNRARRTSAAMTLPM